MDAAAAIAAATVENPNNRIARKTVNGKPMSRM